MADVFSEPWKICNNCKQPFQNQLLIDLASAFVSFAEANYGHPGNSKWDKLKVLSSLTAKITALSPTLLRTDKEMIAVEGNKMLSIIDHTKSDLKMNNWVSVASTVRQLLGICTHACGGSTPRYE